MPRIGFDGRTLASPAAGVRRYASELFGALAALRQDLTIVAVGASPSTPLPTGVERGPDAASLPTNAGWMLTGLPRAAARASLDLFHAPAYTAPFRAPRPLVVTIHDVSYERHPEWYPYRRDPMPPRVLPPQCPGSGPRRHGLDVLERGNRRGLRTLSRVD